MQEFESLRQPLLGELAMSRKREREREEKKMPFIVATYVYASSQGQRTHSARTNLLDLLVNRLVNIYKFYFNNYEFIDVVVNFLQSSDLGFRKMDGFVIHWSFLIGHQVQRSLCIICYIFILQETLSTNPPFV